MRSLRRIERGQDVADVDAHVGGAVALQQHVLQDDADPEADEDARQRVGAEREVEDPALRDETDHRHHRHDDRQRHDEIAAERRSPGEDEVGGEDGEVAVGEVDEAHHPERQREPGGEQGVETAQQDALDDGVDPVHGYIPK